MIEAGGLWIIGTERHESRRIDNQLRGRSGRQGDPGRSTFFLSLEDDLLRIFGGDRMDGMLRKLGLEEGEAIVHPWVNKAIEKAQAKVEARNFDIRKNLLKYDDVVNDQRKILFEQRCEILEAEDIAGFIRDIRHDLIDDLVEEHMPDRGYAENWTAEACEEQLGTVFGRKFGLSGWIEDEGLGREAVRERLQSESAMMAAAREAEYGREVLSEVEKVLSLRVLDSLWREHLESLDHLRSIIGFRGYAQRNPLIEYKAEAFSMFEELQDRFRARLIQELMRIRIVRQLPPDERQNLSEPAASSPSPPRALARPSAMALAAAGAAAGAAAAARGGPPTTQPRVAAGSAAGRKIGRNDPCPCGSGRKFKRCCG